MTGVVASAGCAPGADETERLLVFAASSLVDVAGELGATFTAETGVAVDFGFGSSAALARQVAAGAPAGVLLSADVGLRELVAGRMPRGGAELSFARNELVVVVPAGAPWPRGGLTELERIAVGDWRADVPVGRRAVAWLFAQGLWDEVEPRLLPAVDARATLSAVAAGAADAGIVHATDAASTQRVRVVQRAGLEGPAVLYVAFELDGGGSGVGAGEGAAAGTNGGPARAFVHFLGREPAGSILEAHGFLVAGTPAGRRGQRFPG